MEKVTLKTVAKQVRGVSYKPEDLGKKNLDGFVPLLRAVNIGSSDLHDMDDLVYVSEKKVAKHQYLQPGDILIVASSGSIDVIGKSVYIEASQGFTFGAFCKVVRPNTELINPKFVSFYFQTDFYRKKISNLAQGANINNLKNEHIDNLEIPLPDIETQNKVVAILDKAKAILEKRETTIKKYDELLRNVFVEMFGDPFLNPRKWTKQSIQTLCDKVVDCPHTTPTYLETVSEFPCIRTSEIKNGDIVWESMKYISEESYIERISRLTPKEDDIIFGREGTVGEALLIPPDLKVSLGQRVMLFRVNAKQINPKFFWAQIVSDGIQFEIRRRTIGATVKRINIGDLIQIEFIVPPLELQIQFAKKVEKILFLKRKSKSHQEKCDGLLKSLSQQVFSERITIDVDAELEALVNAIDVERKDGENKIDTVKNDLTFLQRLIDKLQEQDFEDVGQYEKAKYIAFRIMKEEPNLIKQKFDVDEKKMNLHL